MRLEKTITALTAYTRSDLPTVVNPGVQLFVTLGFIVAVVSVPILDPARLLWFFAFPIVMAEALSLGYGRIFLRSLWLLPLIAVIGVFNPIIDRETFWIVGGVSVSAGWVSFISIVLRGLLSVQALLVLVGSCGFNEICRSMGRMGVPSILVTQLLMLYRFLLVLLEEALTMHRARQSRGFGRKSYPLKMWGTFTGQLLVRSLDRAKCINRAMYARGYNGRSIPTLPGAKPRTSDWLYLFFWTAAILFLRFANLTLWFSNLITHS